MQVQFTQQEIDRFWSKVDKSGECWLFTGTPSQRYGQVGIRGRLLLAHRMAYLMAVGEIPDGLMVCHHCDVKRCVRPDHLYVGTCQQNVLDALAHGLRAVGDRHWARLHPEKVQRGDDHWTRKHPERVARGDLNGGRLHPETRARGERIGSSKLTGSQVDEIRHRFATGGVSRVQLGKDFGVSAGCVDFIIRRETWKHRP